MNRGAFICDYAIAPPALPKRVKVFTLSFCGLPYAEISGNAPDPSLLSTGRFYLVSLISKTTTENQMFIIKDQQILFQTQQLRNKLFHYVGDCAKKAPFDLLSA
jgi:hypothetical protein